MGTAPGEARAPLWHRRQNDGKQPP
eukprot:COSAG01_NODE_39665_length_473_cov_1.665775_1_plen_24_part_01